ncbi:MAG: ankyrin repeat domain-containing protein [Wolbachia sp.]
MLETYPAGGAKNFIHGIDYQKLWLMLFFRRAVNRKYFFRLATEMSSAAGFDDIVFLDEQNGTTVCMLIQVKHKQDDSKKICVGDLLTKSGELNLVKHFAAFLEIRGNEEFKDKIKDFFIVINVDFDYESLASKGITVEKIETQDEFLNIGDSAKYKLRDLHNNIAQYLEQEMSAGGREVSDEEIRGFLNELVFVVNLPNDVELEKLIRNEINDDLARRFKYFGNNGYVFNALFTMMSSWMKDKRGRFLTPEEGEKLPSTLSEIKKSQDEIKCVVKRTEEKVDEIVRRKRTSTNGRRAREPIWFNMMEPVASFTGRSSELKALHDALQKSTGKQAVISQVASISGLGGVGKSELARKYAYKYGKYYGGNVIWINAENFEDMKNSFLRLAEDDRLGIPPKDKHGRDKTIEAIVEEIYAFFARRGRRSLFIFDNAEGYKGIKRFLPSSLHPRHKKPYVLITSRDCKWNVRGEGDIKVIQLDEFGEVEALEFVRKALNIENNLQDREIEELTRELQYFPLALGQAVVYIQDRNEESRLRGDKRFKISDYLKEYQQNAGELLKKGVYENEDRYTKTVLTTWNITMTYICKEYGFEALSILEIMAYLAPDNIRIKEIFSKLITDDKAKLWNTVELLNRYSMIKLREGIVNIHRLVQKVTGLNLQKEGREEEVLRRALELINSGNIVKDSTIHVASIWGYASKYGKLIDDFYFSSSYVHGEPLFIKKSAPLHFLAVSGDYEAISAIITHIERHSPGELVKTVNVKDNLGQTPLHHASYNGNLRAVEYLISKGADINVRSENDWVPLHYAPRSGVLAVVKHLISKGADVNARSKDDWVPLHLAACIGELDVVKCLINKGADVNANATKPLYYGTPLHLAAYHGKLNITKCLISEGADVNARDGNNCTSVHRAAYSGKLGVVEYLISKGANVNAEDKDGNIPLHKAVQNGKLNVIKYFVGKGADVNAKNRYDWTLLHCAAYNGQLDIVRYLINKGAEINAKSWSNDTPLHLAVCSGALDAVKCLVGKGAEVNAKSRYGGTTLCLAAMTGNVDIAKCY